MWDSMRSAAGKRTSVVASLVFRSESTLETVRDAGVSAAPFSRSSVFWDATTMLFVRRPPENTALFHYSS
jgi:hypothetical protein